MKIEINDKSLMMIFLLEECNFTCPHCVNKDAPMDSGYKFSFEQLQSCLSDCRSLASIRWVHFTGGEPTLWSERNRDLSDLLLEIAEAGFTPGFTSNGSLFLNYGKCRDFFGKYVDGSSMPLRIYLSIDTFHKNFSRTKERATSLDNIIKCKKELPCAQADLIETNVITVLSKDFNSLLPDDMIRYYESRGVAFGFVPLLPGGRASSFNHLCPDLNSDNPKGLGAFQLFHEEISRYKQRGTKDRKRAEFMNLIGNDYYFANPWRKVAQLSNLPDAIIEAYSNPAGDLHWPTE